MSHTDRFKTSNASIPKDRWDAIKWSVGQEAGPVEPEPGGDPMTTPYQKGGDEDAD